MCSAFAFIVRKNRKNRKKNRKEVGLLAEYDGRVVLKTDIDTGGIKDGANTVKNAAVKMGGEFEKQGRQIQAALNGGSEKAALLSNNLQKATAEVELQTKKVEALKAKIAGLESGKIAPQSSAVADIERTLGAVNAGIEKTKAEITSLYMQLDRLQENAFKAPTGDIAFTTKEQAEFDRLNAKLDELEPKLENDRKKAQDLGKALKTAVGIATQAEIDKTNEKLGQAEIKLDGLKIKAQAAGQKLKNEMTGAGKAVKTAQSGMEKLGKRIAGLGASALVFSVITKGFTMMRNSIGEVLMSNDEFRESIYQLQAAVWTVAEPIYQAILPGIQALVKWLTIGMLYIATFFNALEGRTLEEGIESAKNLQKQSSAYKDTAESAKDAASANDKATDSIKDLNKAAKQANKQLAAFDELMILGENKISEIILPDTPAGDGDIFDGIQGGFEGLKNLLNDSDIKNLQTFQNWVIQNKDTIKTALEIAGLAVLIGGLDAVIKKITGGGGLLDAFGRKDGALDKQKGKLRVEAFELVGVGAAAWATAGIVGWLTKKFFGLNEEPIDETLGDGAVAADELTDSVSNVGLAVDILTDVFGENSKTAEFLSNTLGELNNNEEKQSALTESMTTKQTEFSASVYDTGKNINGLASAEEELSTANLLVQATGENIPEIFEKIKTKAYDLNDPLTSLTDRMNELKSGFNELGGETGKSPRISLLPLPNEVKLKGDKKSLSSAPVPEIINSVQEGINAINKANRENNTESETKDKKIYNMWGAASEQAQKELWEKAGFSDEEIERVTKKLDKDLGDFGSTMNIVGDKIEETFDLLIRAFGVSLPLPGLARGAVLPPSKPFMAVVGDQKNGVNVETPLKTMIDAFNAALDARGGETADININFTGSEARLIRYLSPKISKSSKYRGKNLFTGDSL